MLYEIINPSDPYVMEADDPKAAAMACILLGGGKYALTAEDGSPACPMFLFGDVLADVGEFFEMPFEDALKHYEPALPPILRTVTIGSIGDYRELQDLMAGLPEDEKAKRLAVRHDKRRSSMNDIGSRAAALADAITEKLSAEG